MLEKIMTMNLRDLKVNQSANIVQIKGRGELIQRIRDMGFVRGATIKVIGKAPLYDPIAIKINNQTITLRNNEAHHIFVETV